MSESDESPLDRRLRAERNYNAWAEAEGRQCACLTCWFMRAGNSAALNSSSEIKSRAADMSVLRSPTPRGEG